MPALLLREKVTSKGHTVNAFRTAMTLVNTEYKKFGSLWVYVPGPELVLVQALRRQKQAAAPAEAAPPPAIEAETPKPRAVRKEVEERIDAAYKSAYDTMLQEVGPDAMETLDKTSGPPEVRDRFVQLLKAEIAQFTPEEHQAHAEMERAYLAAEARKREKETACCARAHPARS
jgi:hypothetical protein